MGSEFGSLMKDRNFIHNASDRSNTSYKDNLAIIKTTNVPSTKVVLVRSGSVIFVRMEF